MYAWIHTSPFLLRAASWIYSEKLIFVSTRRSRRARKCVSVRAQMRTCARVRKKKSVGIFIVVSAARHRNIFFLWHFRFFSQLTDNGMSFRFPYSTCTSFWRKRTFLLWLLFACLYSLTNLQKIQTPVRTYFHSWRKVFQVHLQLARL